MATTSTPSARRWDDWSYAGYDPVFAALAQSTPSGARVGVAGKFRVTGVSPILPAMGPALRSTVDYVGPFDHGYLLRYIFVYAGQISGFDR